MADRRVTRNLSNELQARAGAEAQAQASFYQLNAHQQGSFRGTGMGSMAETEVKDTWGFFRSTSEELFLRSLVEGPMGIATPSMEGIGFTNLPQATRGNSEELFHSWILNVENQEAGQPYTPYRTRQASRRLSNELAALIAQQNSQTFHKVDSSDHFLQTGLPFLDNMNGDTGQPKSRNFDAEKGDQAVEFPPSRALSWFQQPHPMTRSRSSELRRRYAAMQGLPVPPLAVTLQKQATQGPHELKNEVATLGGSSMNVADGRLSQSHLSPQAQTSAPSLGTGDSVSTMVNMLKGTLERKKLANHHQQQQHNIVRDLYTPQCRVQDELRSRSTTPQLDTTNREDSPVHRDVCLVHNEADGKPLAAGRMSSEAQKAQTQLRGLANNCQVLTYAPSPSESSGGAPVLSGCGEDPWNSRQTTSNHENNLKRAFPTSVDVNQQPKRQKSISSHPSPISNGPGNCENQLEGILKPEFSKLQPILNVGSVNSPGGSGFTVDIKEDPTKKRRVERQRKMAEAKGRNSAPIIPSDLQAALKRCENLEKEVRSLKLNLSFMNRKDSEQTKQIEELQKQNEELEEEKERLLEELDRLTQY